MKRLLRGPRSPALLAFAFLCAPFGCGPHRAAQKPAEPVATYPVVSDPPPPPQPPPWKPLPPRGSFLSLDEYLEPPDEVIRLLEHEPEPTLILHTPSLRLARLYEQPLVPMSQLSRPRLGLAGFRIDPQNHTRGNNPLHTRLVINHINDPEVRIEVSAPPGSLIENAFFSPDGANLAVSLIYSDKTQLGLIDTTNGNLRVLQTGPLSAIWTEPCNWISDHELLCARPQFEGSPPQVEVKPNIQELIDGAAAAYTYSNLLKDGNDDLLLEHFGSIELFVVDIHEAEGEEPATKNERRDERSEEQVEKRRGLPGPGLITSAALSPDRRYLLTERIERPYPRFLPADRFQRQLAIYDVETGDVVLRVGSNDENSISTSTPFGPRRAAWDPKLPSSILYLFREHRDSGVDVDSFIRREPPFESNATVLFDNFTRVKTWGQTSAGTIYVVDAGKSPKSWVTYRMNDGVSILAEGTETELVGDLSAALKVHGNRGRVLENGGKFYFLAEEVEENRIENRLSEWDSKAKVTRPLWRNLPSEHATVFCVLDPKNRNYLIRSETPAIPPYYVVSEKGKRRAVTNPAPPFVELAGVTRQQIFYRRADSVLLSAMLYLPADFRPGVRLPTVLWIYPRDFSDEQQASRLSEHPQRYFDVRGPSRFALLTQGYALVDAPSMPIVGEVTSGRDDYLPQLVQSAEAVIDYLVNQGISDRDNIAAIGRSYGAFAVANLMSHTSLFRAGIAISGAYNRTLTPFGFQKQTRTFWQNTEAYVNLSPFFFADKVQGSLLLLHGQDDDNPGTPSFQSERFYAALAGNGIKSRYVSFPYEGHQFRGRRTVLHASAEMINWLGRHMKPAASQIPLD